MAWFYVSMLNYGEMKVIIHEEDKGYDKDCCM